MCHRTISAAHMVLFHFKLFTGWYEVLYSLSLHTLSLLKQQGAAGWIAGGYSLAHTIAGGAYVETSPAGRTLYSSMTWARLKRKVTTQNEQNMLASGSTLWRIQSISFFIDHIIHLFTFFYIVIFIADRKGTMYTELFTRERV